MASTPLPRFQEPIPQLKDEVVMVGGHLDSWIAGTGATDNGAGSVVAMEVMRILNALAGQAAANDPHCPVVGRRSKGFSAARDTWHQHFGSFPLSTTPEQMEMPEFLRKPAGPLTLKPEQKLISAYFNVDNGTGKIRGIYTQGNAAVDHIFEQWMAPLKDLGVTTITNRNTGGTDHLSFDAVGHSWLPVHSGSDGLRDTHSPLQYGHLRASTVRGLETDCGGGSDLCLQRGDAGSDDSAQAIASPRTARRTEQAAAGPVPYGNKIICLLFEKHFQERYRENRRSLGFARDDKIGKERGH